MLVLLGVRVTVHTRAMMVNGLPLLGLNFRLIRLQVRWVAALLGRHLVLERLSASASAGVVTTSSIMADLTVQCYGPSAIVLVSPFYLARLRLLLARAPRFPPGRMWRPTILRTVGISATDVSIVTVIMTVVVHFS